jgi:H+-translocating NAD(P) transhydrogenase subunit alpha
MALLFVPREPGKEERRVAAVPDTVKRLVKEGHAVRVEAGAGERAFFRDADYAAAGAVIEADAARGWAEADVVLHVDPPRASDVARMKAGASLLGLLWASEHLEVAKALQARRLSAFALDALPRTTRAQKDDALTSQASLAGYKAVVLAAAHLPKILPMQMTPAGTIRPARVVVIGVGVAGLQAIATARRLGAVVEASDVRPETKEQVQSLGAAWIEVEGAPVAQGTGGYAAEQTEDFKRRQQEALRARVIAADVVITTALVPYRPAPKIVPASVVAQMRPGSVIVDLAAERGGNCEATVPGSIVVKDGVTIIGTLDLASSVAVHASDQYARNVQNVVLDSTKKGVFAWDLSDEVTAGALVVHDGEPRQARLREALGLSPLPAPAPAAPTASAAATAGARSS